MWQARWETSIGTEMCMYPMGRNHEKDYERTKSCTLASK
jgi:hypothetical protein